MRRASGLAKQRKRALEKLENYYKKRSEFEQKKDFYDNKIRILLDEVLH